MIRGDEIRRRIEWTPQRISDLRVLVAEGLSDGKIARILKLSRNTVVGARWRFKLVSCNAEKHAHRITPSDFGDIGPTLTVEQAAKHYKASPTTIRKWHREFDSKPAIVARVYEKKVREPKATKAPKPRSVAARQTIRAFRVPERQVTLAASAQLFLQRYGPVIRARTIDPAAANDQWIVNGRRLSEAEMLAAAERKGFISANSTSFDEYALIRCGQ